MAIVLLLVFSAAVLWGRARLGRRLPCGCFGRETRARDYRAILVRNVALLGVALLVMEQGYEPGNLAIGAPVSPQDVVPVLFVVAGIGLLTWTIRMVLVAFRGERERA